MKVAIVGAGTAGLLCAAELCEGLPEFAKIDLIYSPNIRSIEVGESTLVKFPSVLSGCVDYSHFEDKDKLNSTTKYGVMFRNWNGDKFIPFASGAYGMHFDTKKFPEYILPKLKELYPNFSEIHKEIKDIVSLGKKVSVDGVEYDFAIDCRGFPEDYSDYYISPNVYLNAGIVVSSRDTPGTWEYTYHVAHRNGWMFGIPLKEKSGWGYLYNSDLTHRDDAFADLIDTLSDYDVRPYLPEAREFSFKNYYAKSVVNRDCNIFVNGNRALFLEPIQATSLSCYSLINEAIVDFIVEGVDYDTFKQQYYKMIEEAILFINIHYKNGSNFDSPFWNNASSKSTKLLDDYAIHNYTGWKLILDQNNQFRKRMFANFL
tara:strand:+ start:301 stop:1419 length:1119 start_codon:yes stop_codon:yes gene_type:complete